MILDKNEMTAEFVGLMLGDGCLCQYKKNNRLYQSIDITLNKKTETMIIDRVKLMMYNLFDVECKIVEDNSTVRLRYYNHDIFAAAISLGLIPGNKMKKQVSVPLWVKSDRNFIIACLRGLVDTDGCIHVLKNRSGIYIDFVNMSIPLLNDFFEMCLSLDIHTSKSKRVVNIESKNDVRKFIEIIKPIKWEIIKSINSEVSNNLNYKINRYDHDLGIIYKIVDEREGILISATREGNTVKLLLKCKKGHIWSVFPKSIRAGRWCPKCGEIESIARLLQFNHDFKFVVDKDELECLVRKNNLSEIGRMFGVSSNAIKKRCKKFGIIDPVKLRRESWI